MPFRKRTSPGPGRGLAGDSPIDAVKDADADTHDAVLSLADEAEAEADEAEAVAAAARARARALRLRREAEQARASRVEPPPPEPSEVEPGATEASEADTIDAADSAGDSASPDVASSESAHAVDDADTGGEPVGKSARTRRALRIPLPTAKGLAITFAVVLIAALLSASGYMIWHHRQVERTAQLNGEYSAASRQAVVTLMSLDFNNAEEDVQRIIENSTGKFKEDFQAEAETFAQVAQESKVVTEVTVNSTAVKTMDDTTANVLVSATSRVTNTSGANQDPRAWRLSVDLQRDGDQIKMARVEFVP